MKKLNRILKLIGLLVCTVFLYTLYTLPTYAHDSISEYDLIEEYVAAVNASNYSQIANLFELQQKEELVSFFSNSQNRIMHNGVFNVKRVTNYELYDLPKSLTEENTYIIMLDCEVYSSNQFFIQGKNYFRLVTTIEDGQKKIKELSIAPNDILEHTIPYEKADVYLSSRQSVLSQLTCFDDNQSFCSMSLSSDDGMTVLSIPNYNPEPLTSYALPTTIRVKKTGGGIVTVNFKTYCCVVSATEFGVGTDGKTAVAYQALKAFSLCVKNFGWYRCLYPYSPTEGYNITDDKNNQVYNWQIAANNTFTNNINAMNETWAVIMLDKNRKLFLPSYRSGKYNGAKSSTEALLYQNGANYLATEKGYTYKNILYYYYDSTLGGLISGTPIIICDSHISSSTYYYNGTSHWKVCTRCGKKINVIAHNFIISGSNKECRICKYRTSNISSLRRLEIE